VDVIDFGGARRFSRERPNRFVLLDRPRLVCDLVCLEPGQREDPRENASSDELYYVIDGRATLRIGVHEYEVGTGQAILVPPQMRHWLANPGPGRLTALAVVSPKPGREAEVRPRRPAAPARGRETAEGGRERRPSGRGRAGAEAGRGRAAPSREREAPRPPGRRAGPRPGARGRPPEPPSGGPEWPGPSPRGRAGRRPETKPSSRPARGRASQRRGGAGQRLGGTARPRASQPGKGGARRQRRS
jgi:mannose-6-phosphate isomerase-like protein (cupin superfamily)